MPFANEAQVRDRLRKAAPLPAQEIADSFPYIPTLSEGDLRLVWAQLALLTMLALHENRNAIEKFDASSTKLTTRIYWLTWALQAGRL